MVLRKKLQNKLKKPKSILYFAERVKSDFLSILKQEGRCFEECDDFDEISEIQDLITETEEMLNDSMQKCNSPFRVSMIGAFSSGKTSTLCTLLNNRMLPRLQRPTSGNVVEMLVVPQNSDENTEKFKCIFFSLLELEDVVRDYYTWLIGKKVQMSELPVKRGFLKESINDLQQEVERFLLREWSQQKNSGVKSLIVLKGLSHLHLFLTTLKYYFFKYPENDNIKREYSLFLPYSQDSKDTQEKLETVTVLDMEKSLDELHPEKISENINKLWKYAPSTFKQLQDACSSGDIHIDVLRAFFPLYKRIVVTTKIDFSGLWEGINTLSFLDFPGINSGNRRDIYLCLKELSLAHTNMLFMLANRPSMEDVEEPINLIAEAKNYGIDISDRMIPIINFFETYAHSLEKVDEEDNSVENAMKRVEKFFFEKAGMIERGFNLFDSGILSHLGTDAYHLLTPVAGADPENLNEDEKNFLRRYEENASLYKQLLNDIKVARTELRKDKASNKEIIKKYKRLEDALKDYVDLGGITGLREALVDTLKIKGKKLIAQDARLPLIEAMERFHSDIIQHLEDEDLEIDDDELEENITREASRREITALWKQMEVLTLEWTRQGNLIELVYKEKNTQKNSVFYEYVSPLKICESKVLQVVLSSKFWKMEDKEHNIRLSELSEQYNKMLEELNLWCDETLYTTVENTLERLDNTKLELETGDNVSFQDIHTNISENYLDQTKIDEQDKNTFRSLFTLRSEIKTCYNLLKRRYTEEKNQQNTTINAVKNHKMPFNENITLNWSPFEIMKIQRQVITSLERYVTQKFAFYMSVFFHEFLYILNKRLDSSDASVHRYFEIFNKENGVFDLMAKIPQKDEEPDEDELTRRQLRRKTREVATRLLDTWQELMN